MSFVYESELHVYNIIAKSLKNRDLLIKQEEKQHLERLIGEAWEIQNNEHHVLEKYNTHRPLDVLTWHSRFGDYFCTDELVDLLEDIVGIYFVLLLGDLEGDEIDRSDPSLEIIFRNSAKETIDTKVGGYVADEFVHDMEFLKQKTGVYFLYDNEEKLVYVGKSSNLGERLVTSIRERGSRFYEYALTKSCSDTEVYEAYYISLLKPELNIDGKHSDDLTIALDCIRDKKIKPIFKEGERK